MQYRCRRRHRCHSDENMFSRRYCVKFLASSFTHTCSVYVCILAAVF